MTSKHIKFYIWHKPEVLISALKEVLVHKVCLVCYDQCYACQCDDYSELALCMTSAYGSVVQLIVLCVTRFDMHMMMVKYSG